MFHTAVLLNLEKMAKFDFCVCVCVCVYTHFLRDLLEGGGCLVITEPKYFQFSYEVE